jgi:uncharacterized protein YjlB
MWAPSFTVNNRVSNRKMTKQPQKHPEPGGVHQLQFTDDGTFPNSHLPLLVYPKGIVPGSSDLVTFFEACFTRNGWPAAWRNGIYGFHHYHSTAHEVLGICRGRARVQMGGASGDVLTVTAGDAVVIPAGVAHKNLGASDDFLVVGAYPEGQSWDMNDGSPGERPQTDENIRTVRLPAADPLMGSAGPLTHHWS